MNAHVLALPFLFLWHRLIRPLFRALDWGLVQIATLFGAMEPDVLRRAVWMNGVFLALYGIALLPVPWVPLIALLFAYVGVLAIGRAWVANEKVRTNVVKMLDDTNPDTLPDLRGVALASALHLLILFPLLLWQLSVQYPGQLFRVPDTSFGTWLTFAFDPYTTYLFDQIGAHSPEQDVTATSAAGRLVILLKRLTLDWILIQGVVRLFAIRTTIQEAVAALGQHPEITIRLGRRAVGPLTKLLKDPNPHLRAQAALVLGQLKATEAMPALIEALNDPVPEVRWRAVTALGEIRNPEATGAILRMLRDSDPNTAREALEALVALDARHTAATLREWLRGTDPAATRALVAEGLRHLAGKEAVDALIASLRDPEEEVSKTAAASLGLLGDPKAVAPLGQIVADASTPNWLRYEAAKALGELRDPGAGLALRNAMRDPDPQLRRLAARGLGAIGDLAAGPVLLAALLDPVPEVREATARSIGVLRVPDGAAALVDLLGDSRGEVADAAAEGLISFGPQAAGFLRAALAIAEGERRKRIETVLGQLKG